MTAALGLVDDPKIRGAALDAASPVARLSFNVGKRMAQRRAHQRAEQVRHTVIAISTWIAAYGPQLAQEFGLVEQPKLKRTAPRVIAGAVIGAGAMYLLDPQHRHEHRRQLQRLLPPH
jgi:hypothetical protein